MAAYTVTLCDECYPGHVGSADELAGLLFGLGRRANQPPGVLLGDDLAAIAAGWTVERGRHKCIEHRDTGEFPAYEPGGRGG